MKKQICLLVALLTLSGCSHRPSAVTPSSGATARVEASSVAGSSVTAVTQTASTSRPVTNTVSSPSTPSMTSTQESASPTTTQKSAAKTTPASPTVTTLPSKRTTATAATTRPTAATKTSAAPTSTTTTGKTASTTNAYPLITDKLYVIKRKLCSDGSGWVGFPVPCSMDNMEYSPRVQALKAEMWDVFCDWYGVSVDYIVNNPDKFQTNMVSDAGMVKTTDGQITPVIYWYMRGVRMPIDL